MFICVYDDLSEYAMRLESKEHLGCFERPYNKHCNLFVIELQGKTEHTSVAVTSKLI